MAVKKFKPTVSPRAFDFAIEEARDKTQKAMGQSRVEVARSRDLIRKSKEIVAAAHKLRNGG